ncbi:MAG: hypothetical protein P3B98_00705 [Gemmatimonadota bacterium]|nr:hypothetical protein [Gemmatimonadota bacterium]
MRHRLFSAFTVVAAAACVTPSARQAPAPAPTATTGPKAPNVAGPWALQAFPASHRIALTTQATVTITTDGTTRVDTVQAVLGASYAWASRSRLRLDGSLTDYRVAFGTQPPAMPSGLQLPRAFTAQAAKTSESLAFQLPAESSACTDPAFSAMQGLHEAWIRLPDTLKTGAEWSDTVRTLSCRDRIPLRGIATRRFRVVRGELEANGRVVVLIDRFARGRTVGDGEQFGELVALSGESSGTLRYAVDPATGQVLRAAGTNVLTLALTSSRRKQHVRQESQIVLTWNP